MSAVLWDLDDTVLDTLQHRMRSLEHAYRECLGESVDAEAVWRSHRGGSLEALGQRLLGNDYRRFVESYRDHYYGRTKRVLPFNGVERVLAHFHSHGIPMAVVTSKVSWGATEELHECGLLQYFGAVVGVDDTELPKPNAEPIYEALERLLLEPTDRVIMIGDSPADMLAARNAGVRSVAATWGTIDRELLLDTGPDHVALKPEEVIACYAQPAVAR